MHFEEKEFYLIWKFPMDNRQIAVFEPDL